MTVNKNVSNECNYYLQQIRKTCGIPHSKNISLYYFFSEGKVMGIGFSTKVDALPIENTVVLISSCENENIENHLECSTT